MIENSHMLPVKAVLLLIPPVGSEVPAQVLELLEIWIRVGWQQLSMRVNVQRLALAGLTRITQRMAPSEIWSQCFEKHAP